MQALVLVGGEGTRLRPLTLTRPKPALRLVDRPFIRFMVEWLARHGVTRTVLACGFQPAALRHALGDEAAGIEIAYLHEPEPLGTAGPIRFAADLGLLEERFCVLNGDVLTDLDLSALVRAHSAVASVATLGLYPVADPGSYGLVRRSEDGQVLEFLEKPDPAAIDTDEINAGMYVLDADVVELIPSGRAVSIEREVFPQLVEAGRLRGHRLEGYWMDIGTPPRYLQATWDILDGAIHTDVTGRLDAAGVLVENGAQLDEAAAVAPPGLVETGCRIGPGVRLGPRAVLGAGCVVGAEATLRESVLDDECRVGAGARIEGAILARGAEVGPGARVGSGAVIGEAAVVGSHAEVRPGARVQPQERVGAGP